jgi:hypothetical protein
MAWRKGPFEKHKRYSVKQNFSKFSQQFQEGQILEFVDEAYSRYDNLTAYSFTDAITGLPLSLEIIDDEPIETWSNFFEEIQ